ncbi:Selenide, water dikinase [Porphyridium purpureum]|uniref:Selenide, water dikinase n=1 Tax=Porphyridium purpureum TaxID=35688 RepID=A0A5J4YK03_PORPP|nr:Selenide, water dikinase [Porphyridium purpureum]|eukprot:POR1505..scf244_11
MRENEVGQVASATHGLLMDCSEVELSVGQPSVGGTPSAVETPEERQQEDIGAITSAASRSGTDTWKLVSTHDFFFPLLDDPYVMGKIGAANVLSDLYAHGATEPDTVLMTLALSSDMSKSDQRIVAAEMVRGFRDTVREGGCEVTGGQTVVNPWPIIGGTAISVVPASRLPPLTSAQPGDVLVLTKPLGTQVAVNLFQWYSLTQSSASKSVEEWSAAETQAHLTWQSVAVERCGLSGNDAERAMDHAARSMTLINREASTLMRVHGSRASTDVTGFGILGHAQRLAQNQKQNVVFEINCLPVLRQMMLVNDAMNAGRTFKLRHDEASVTSNHPTIPVAVCCGQTYQHTKTNSDLLAELYDERDLQNSGCVSVLISVHPAHKATEPCELAASLTSSPQHTHPHTEWTRSEPPLRKSLCSWRPSKVQSITVLNASGG